MPPSRPAAYYLGCLDSSVFIDFNLKKDQSVYLRRISFDGYGCCNLPPEVAPMSKGDSTLFMEAMKQKELDQDLITPLVLRTLTINKNLIWEDALKKYELLTEK